jgi:carbonic anhydrase
VLFQRILRDNEEYQLERQLPGMDPKPSERLALLTCMDVRIDTYGAFGLHVGEAHVLRNAGGRVTDDVLRSLVLSCHMLGVREVGVVHHTGCGLLGDGGAMLAELERSAGVLIPLDLHVIEDPSHALERDVGLLRTCAYLPSDLVVWGAVFDVTSGHLTPVVDPG